MPDACLDKNYSHCDGTDLLPNYPVAFAGQGAQDCRKIGSNLPKR